MAEKKKRKGKKRRSTDEESNSTVTDGRFAHIHHDPRFERLPSKKTKVAVDERFAGVFEERRFAQPKVDKYGRKVKTSATGDKNMRRLYDDSGGADIGDTSDKAVSGDDTSSDSDEAAAPMADSHDLQGSDGETTGVLHDEPGDEADYNESGSESESEDEQPEWAKDLEDNEEAEEIEMGDAHRRLAILDCEWDRMNSTDVLAIVKSFVPPGGSVERVTVYPSEIGMKAMAEEEQHGPKLDGVVPTPITNDDSTEADADEEFDPEILRKYEQGKLKWFFAVVDCDSIKTAQSIYKECDGLEFERSGIVLDVRYIPDDVQFSQAPRDTATAVTLNYKAPLFTNKAASHSKVELTWDRDDPERFKLRKNKFTKDQINDIDLQAYLASESDDEDDDEKERRHQGREKLRALLGEGGGDGEGGGENGGSDDDGVGSGSESEQEDMVITFDGGLRDVGKDILEKKKKRDLEAKETTWESYLRKRAEKKAAKKAARKKSAQHNRNGGAGKEEEDLGFDDPFFQTQDKDTGRKDEQKSSQESKDPFDDPFLNTGDDGDMDAALDEMESNGKKKDKSTKKKKKTKKKDFDTEDQSSGAGDGDDDPIAKAQKARERAELELIVGGDDEREDERENSFNMKHVGKKKKKKNKSRRKQLEEDDDSDAPNGGDDGFRVDTADDRFAAIFDSHQFAIDPNDPKYKKTPAMEKVMDERQERRKKKRRQRLQQGESVDSEVSLGTDEHKKQKKKTKRDKKQDIAQLVASVKRKAA